MSSTKPEEAFMNQRGVVSVVVSVIIMIVLTLIAIAFAQIMRREQRQALDRQLSSQAYYAAESAINDAAYALSLNPEALADFGGINSTDCIDDTSGNLPLTQGGLDAGGDDAIVEYTCVTINSTPDELRYDAVKIDETTQVELLPINAAGQRSELDSLTFEWRNNLGNTTFPSDDSPLNLPQVWNTASTPGILRVEIIPIENTFNSGAFTRENLLDNRRVYWLYPTSDGSQNITWGANSTEIAAGQCVADSALSGGCSVTISGMPTTDDHSYVIRMRSVYAPVEVTINGVLVNTEAARFQGAQTQIDATGRANDVLRRISARIALEQSSSIPEYVLHGYDRVCKSLEVVNDNDVNYGCN